LGARGPRPAGPSAGAAVGGVILDVKAR
jgi:hypothetical protein